MKFSGLVNQFSSETTTTKKEVSPMENIANNVSASDFENMTTEKEVSPMENITNNNALTPENLNNRLSCLLERAHRRDEERAEIRKNILLQIANDLMNTIEKWFTCYPTQNPHNVCVFVLVPKELSFEYINANCVGFQYCAEKDTATKLPEGHADSICKGLRELLNATEKTLVVQECEDKCLKVIYMFNPDA